MKTRILIVLTILAVLVSSTVACKSKANYLIQGMKLAPENTEAVFCTDINAFAEDPDLNFAYNEIISGLGHMIPFVEPSDISGYTEFEIAWESIIMLFGDFNLQDIRDALTEEYYVEGEYKGIEIWTDDYDDAVTFIDNMIIYGYKDLVEACIRVYNNEEPSMYDNEDMKVAADRLPSGISYMVFGPDVMYSIEILSGNICWINTTSNDSLLDISGWLKFDSAASAEAAMESIEDDLSWELDFTVTDTSLSGQFIEVTGEVEIPED